MRPFLILGVTGILVVVAYARWNGAAEPISGDGGATSALGQKIDDLTLADYRGKVHRLSDIKEARAVVVVFLGTECPLAKLYTARLVELSRKYRDLGAVFWAIDSNAQDSMADLAHHAKTHGIEFPLLKDVGNKVADAFAAERTPEAFLLNGDRKIVYRGAIDDQYGIGVQRPKATDNYLADAIDDVLAGRPVAKPNTEAVGCIIGRVREPNDKSKVTYSNQIARLFQRRCVECHREGEIAPFVLTDYESAAGWAEMIREVVDDGRMPPWLANPEHGHFANDARLTEQEKQLIDDWVEAGAPEGDRSQLSPSRTFTEGWRIPEPDLVIPMRGEPFDVPAEGEVKYQYFVVDPGFTEGKWIRAAECRPGNRAVVHHIIAFVKPPKVGGRFDPARVKNDWLAAMAPGSLPMNLPDGFAKFIPAGSKLVFQVHYTPNGTPQKDMSELGLVFADPETVRREVGTWRAANRRFKIPPGAKDHKVTASHTFDDDTILLAMFPHMHLRGKSFRYEAVYPDGQREILLDVPRYDFNWQLSYIPSIPKRMPAGTKLVCTAHYDNSPDNPNNPDPTATVGWGDQTWEEMMIGYFAMMRVSERKIKTDESD